MEIINHTPLLVETLPFSKGPSGKPVLTIIVKGTFDIVPNGIAAVSSDQISVAYGDEFYNEDGGSTKFEADIAPFKPRGDIVLVGSAYVPGGRSAESLDVSLRVGNISKNIHVIGNRHWVYGSIILPVSISKTEPFQVMEITYERAFGGIDKNGGDWCKENPIGRGFFTKKSKEAIDNAPLPNLEDPEDLIRFWDDHPKPMGFGFYGRMWAPRGSYLGTYDEKWRKERSPDPPDDFQFDYYNGANPDLQVSGYLRGDEEVELTNLTEDGWVRFRLPGVNPSVIVSKSDELPTSTTPREEIRETREKIDLNLDTLCIIPDEKKVYLVWRGLCIINDLGALEIRTVEISTNLASK